MATRLEKKPTAKPQPKMVSASSVQKTINKAVEEAVNNALQDVGVNTFTCIACSQPRKKSDFYVNANPVITSGIVPICKKCCDKIIYQIGEDGVEHPPTKESVISCLILMNKPFITSVWESSIMESANTMSGRIKRDVWKAYIKNLQSLKQYYGATWKDSDTEYLGLPDLDTRPIVNDKEVVQMYEINKKTVISALGYDPFATASDEDKPLMYNKLAGLLDESTSEDEVKLGACVEITHAFNQTERLNSVINSLQKTPESITKNASNIKVMVDTKNNIFKSMISLAKENGITINSSNKNTKGSNTWSGKVKELKELHLRDAEVNAFDVGTSEGMRQVADASIEAIFKQLSFDENDYTEMIKQQKMLIEQLEAKLNALEEESRIFRRENHDLKDYLRDKHLINENDEVIE